MSPEQVAELLASHAAVQHSFHERQRTNAELKEANEEFARQVDWFKRQLVGSKSERRIADPGQQLILAETAATDPDAPERQIEVPAHRRRRRASRTDEEGGFRSDPSVPVITVLVPNDQVPAEERENYYVVGERVTDRREDPVARLTRRHGDSDSRLAGFEV